MSAAGLLLAAGDRRLIGSRSWFMFHESQYGISTKGHSEVKDFVEQIEREEKAWARSMAEFSNQDAIFWLNVAHKKDVYLDAHQCLEFGVVDGLF